VEEIFGRICRIREARTSPAVARQTERDAERSAWKGRIASKESRDPADYFL